jgi:hypothetical protein
VPALRVERVLGSATRRLDVNTHIKTLAASVAVLSGSMVVMLAQGGSTPRDFDAEIRAALQSAKTAAGVEFTGVLSTNCLLPASGADLWR